MGVCLYAFVDKLRTVEGGIPAASDNRFAGRAADMGVAVSCFFSDCCYDLLKERPAETVFIVSDGLLAQTLRTAYVRSAHPTY